MVQVTNEQLIELRDSNNLTTGETYEITDYSGPTTVIMKAVDSKTFADESTTTRPNISIHYDLDSGKIDYMKDIIRRIEGYFDWADNIGGECSDIYFENAELLSVTNSSNVICERIVGEGSSVTNSSYITLGDGCTVTISGSDHISVDANSTATITGCNEITLGSRNNVSLNKRDGLAVADDNASMTFSSNTCIVGSRNKSVTLNGVSNVIDSHNVDVSVQGDLNNVAENRYVTIGGAFNKVKKTQLSSLTNSVGNTLEISDRIDVTATHDNYISTSGLELTGAPSLLGYVSPKGSPTKAVTNLVEPINLQSDCEGRILIVDQSKFYQETGNEGTKGNVKYTIVDGQWTPVQV